MKNLLALCALALSLPAAAQPLQSFGLKAGLTAASAFDNIADYERRLGLDVRAYVEGFDLGAVSLVTEAGYAQRGFVEVQEELGPSGEHCGTVKSNTRLDYLTAALLVKAQREGAFASPYVLAGPRLDALVGRRPGTFEYSVGPSESQDAGLYDSPAFGGTVGAGAVLHRLPVPVLVEARFNLDVTDSMPGIPRDVRNNAFDLLIGIRLR